VFDEGPSGKSRGVAALLAILLGSLGIHYFYLGKNTAGIIFLLVTLLSCGVLGTVVAILSLVSGVLMLTTTEEDFEQKYVNSNSTMPI
jgi:TM2 domain-containing membrane protein YozV